MTRALHGHNATEMIGARQPRARRKDLRHDRITLRKTGNAVRAGGQIDRAAAPSPGPAEVLRPHGADADHIRIGRRIGDARPALGGEEVIACCSHHDDAVVGERGKLIAQPIVRVGRRPVLAVAQRQVHDVDAVVRGVGHDPL